MPKAAKTNAVSADVKKYVRKQLQRDLEVKRREYDGFATTSTNTGWVLAYPAQGLSSEERVGDVIIMKHFSMTLNLYNLSAAICTYRLVVFMADAPSLVTAANLFLGGPGNYIQGHPDTNYVTVLHDQVFQLDIGGGQSAALQKKIKMNKKISFLLGTQTPKEEYIHVWIGTCDSTGVPSGGLARFVANFQIGFTDA